MPIDGFMEGKTTDGPILIQSVVQIFFLKKIENKRKSVFQILIRTAGCIFGRPEYTKRVPRHSYPICTQIFLQHMGTY